ncbi:MAG: hypothetical protein WA724_05970 [Candidatus Dormiibacterota bacterium]
MNQTSATLLVAAACLFGVGLFALIHRRDAMGAVLALLLGFNAVASALVGLSGLASRPTEAAQLQSFALVVEVMGALWAAAGISMAALLRRRTGGQDLLDLVTLGPRMETGTEPGGDEGAPPTPVPQEEKAVEGQVADTAVDADEV